MTYLKATATATAALMLGSTAAYADEITFLCYQDGNECEVIEAMVPAFTEATGHTVKVDTWHASPTWAV